MNVWNNVTNDDIILATADVIAPTLIVIVPELPPDVLTVVSLTPYHPLGSGGSFICVIT